MYRGELLDLAKETCTKERTGHYGEPENVFNTIAKYWDAYLTSISHRNSELNKTDVAMMMALLKIARGAPCPDKLDTYVDLAGYAACAAEVQGVKEPEEAVLSDVNKVPDSDGWIKYCGLSSNLSLGTVPIPVNLKLSNGSILSVFSSDVEKVKLDLGNCITHYKVRNLSIADKPETESKN